MSFSLYSGKSLTRMTGSTENTLYQNGLLACLHQESTYRTLEGSACCPYPLTVSSLPPVQVWLASQQINKHSQAVNFGAKLIPISPCPLSCLGTKARLLIRSGAVQGQDSGSYPVFWGHVQSSTTYTCIVHLSHTTLEGFFLI